MAALVLFPLLTCFALSVGSAIVRSAALQRFAGVAAATVVLASGVALVVAVLGGDTPTAISGQLRVDALSAYMLTVVGAVGLTALWGGLADRAAPPGRAYPTLVTLFLGAMSLAVLADNLGVLWVAVEATTIATAFLVGHARSRRSLEAAWKYVVLGSVGVAIAFLGIVLLYAATLAAGTPDPVVVAARGGRTAARPVPRHGGWCARRPGVRHQGGAGPGAQLASRRAQPGTGAGLRPDVRCPALGGLLRHPARPGGRRPRRRARV